MAKKRKAGGMYPGIAGMAASTAEKAKEQYYRNLAFKYTKDNRMSKAEQPVTSIEEDISGVTRLGDILKKRKEARKKKKK